MTVQMKALQHIEQFLPHLNKDSLQELSRKVRDEYNRKQREEEAALARTFRVGDEVEFLDSRRGRMLRGTIKSINDRTVSLNPINGVRWRVGFEYLRKAA